MENQKVKTIIKGGNVVVDNSKPGVSKLVERRIIYAVENPLFGVFLVKWTSNGWWLNRGKLERLVNAHAMGLNGLKARAYAGITENQERAFLSVHDDFPRCKEALLVNPDIKAKITIYEHLDNLSNAQWFEEQKLKKIAQQQAPSQHIHFHQSDQIKQIVFEAEEKLKQALIEEINEDERKAKVIQKTQ